MLQENGVTKIIKQYKNYQMIVLFICINYSIPVGKNNRYGHPNKEVVKNLENSKMYRTDLNGSIIFEIVNNKLNIETCIP